MTEPLVVSEVFGPTLQGEGPSLGRRAGFIRLGRCNLACSWCDTPYTWDWERCDPAVELTECTTGEIAAAIEAMGVPLVVITGGEPMLQQRHLPALLARLRGGGQAVEVEVEVETAGTITPIPDVVALVDRFNVSPKLAHSGNPLDRRYKPDVLRAFEATRKACFKFVVDEVGALDEAASIVDECGLTDVWVMPEGTDAATLLARQQRLAPAVLARGWSMTTRLHILLWGDERGR